MGGTDARALARGRAYDLFSALLIDGVRSERLAQLASIPALREHLGESPDLDTLGAEHHRVYAREVFPFESVFLGTTGLVGGACADAVRTLMERAGRPPRRDEADHLGEQLALLAHLGGAEVDARRDGAIGALEVVRELQRAALDDHLLRWVPAFALSVSDLATPLHAAVLELLLDVLADHRESLPGAPADWSLPPAGLDLGSADTGLAEVGAWLVAPGRSGIFLSQAGLAEVGRALGMPVGFGRRVQVAENLFQAAARVARVPDLARALAARMDETADRLSAIGGRGPFPVSPWCARLAESAAVLRALGDGALRAGSR